MVDIKLASDRTIKAIVLAAFPSYRKRSAGLSTFASSGQNINSYWDGGSRDEYAIVDLSTMTKAPMPTVGHPYFEVKGAGVPTGEDQYVIVDHVGNVTLKSLPQGYVLVRAGTFCGKPSTAHVYAHASDLTKLLPAAEVTR